jgi:predicted RNase H-related nuclease YkuK (DUF458 family)
MLVKDFDVAKEAIKNSSQTSSVYIGSDSIRFKKEGAWYARYSTVVILHMDSNKGGKIYYRTIVKPDYGNIRARLMTEVQEVVEVAEEVIDSVGERHLEIHLDLNADPKHKSNVAVKEALGWVRGVTGLQAKIKPYSFAASYAADHCVRGKPM